MELLIIGGTGYLSSAIVETAIAAGHAVTVVTRGSKSDRLPAEARHVVADRNDPAQLRAALGGRDYDAVIDCICYNEGHARTAVEVFAGHAGRLVTISTDFVYRPGDRRLPVTEDAPRESSSGYGQGKRAAEDLLLGPDSPLPATVLRPPHVVGAGALLGTGSWQGRDAALIARLRRGEPTVLLEGGQFLIQPADRRDIGAACLAVIGGPACAGRAYNMAGPQAVTTRRYYEIVAEILGVPLHIASLPASVYLAAFPDRDAFAQHRMYSLDALARDAGFRPSIALEQSLREMVGWLEANPPAGYNAEPTESETKLLALLANRDSAALDILL